MNSFVELFANRQGQVPPKPSRRKETYDKMNYPPQDELPYPHMYHHQVIERFRRGERERKALIQRSRS